jgi:two-component sensor histidine kinase/CHASE1-domain containing sensor protein
MAFRRKLLIYAALPLAYVICGRLGLLLAVPPGYATAVFLPAGISIAATFVAGRATLPGTFLGSFLLNIWTGYSLAHQLDPTGVAAAFIIALASTAQAAAGGTMLGRFIGYPAPLDNSHDILRFLVLSPACCLVSATLSLGGLWILGLVPPADLLSNWTTWWAGDSLGVLVAFPLVLILTGEPRTLWRSRASFVATPMVICFAVFVAIFVRVSKWENDQSLLQFRIQSQQITDKLKASLEEQALFLEQLSSVFANRRVVVTSQDFHSLVQQLLLRFPTIQAVEWAPKVLSTDRAAFEAKHRSERADFSIRERDAANQLRPAGERALFYPVTYVEPLSGNESAVGFDLASENRRRAAIDGAIDNGQVTASAPLHLVQQPSDQAGILLTYAVPIGLNGSGVVLTVLRMAPFTATLAEPFQSILSLRLSDASSAQTLFNSLPAAVVPTYESRFAFGSHGYVVQTAPSAAYLASHRGWQSWAVLAAGALGTSLLGGLLLLGTGHTFRVEKLAAQLHASEARIAADLLAMTRLNQLANHLMGEGGEIHKCLKDVVETAIAITGAAKGNVQLLDSDSNALTIAAQSGFQGPFLKFFEHVGDDASACAEAMRSGKRVVVEDVTASPIFAGHPSQNVLLDAGVRAVISTPLTSSTGHLLGMVSTHFSKPHCPSERELSLVDLLARQTADYLERTRAHEVEKTLLREIQHRNNNLLAVIQAIAHRSLSGDSSLAVARAAFDARLQALARANRQLTQSNWGGVNLSELVRQELEPFADRMTVEGINVRLMPQQAQNLSLAVHELATNAAKHGALSNKTGNVHVFWTATRQGGTNVLKFNWQERGGPPVLAPTRHGFGSSLLKATFPEIHLDFATGGLNCEIDLPLSSVEAA